MTTDRPQQYRFHNGEKAVLPFEIAEYEARVAELRERMEATDKKIAAKLKNEKAAAALIKL